VVAKTMVGGLCASCFASEAIRARVMGVRA
jgi:hypothetical protein